MSNKLTDLRVSLYFSKSLRQLKTKRNMREGTVISIDSSLLFKCYKAHGIFSWVFFCSEEALSIVGEEGKD